MFTKLIDRFYYGKSGKSDYSKMDLPKNRLELFFTVLKVRFSNMFLLNIAYILIFIPTIYVLVDAVFNIVNVLVNASEYVSSANALVDVNVLDTMKRAIENIILVCLIRLVPCILITGPLTAGISYNMSCWAKDQHAFMWSDVKDALKANWKQALGISAINAIMPLLIYVGVRFYGQVSSSPLMVILQALLVIIGIMWWLSMSFFYPLMISYKLKFLDIIRNAFILSIVRLPHAFLIRLITFAPVLISFALANFVGVQYGVLFAIAYYGLFGLSLSRLIYASFSNYCFDKFINPRIEGAKVNEGLISQDMLELENEIEQHMQNSKEAYIEVDQDEHV